tara:strand:- start:442 stop:2319 length:1878 start_codon:yes stop_codon:yes gene_type:complete
MAKQGITTGTTPNDGTGDTLLSGAVKINSNFDEIYNYFGNGSNLSFTSVVWPSNDTGIHTTSKVGIGTTTASEQLTVSGNISVPDDKYSYYGTSNDLKIRHNTALGNEISNLNNKALYINDGNVVNTWFKVDSSGAVFSPAGITSVGAGITFKGTDGSILAKNQKIAGIITTGNLVATQDLTVAGKITGVGSITGATIHGSGAGLSNIVTSVTAGAGVTVSASTGGITISSASGGAQGYFQKNATGINTSSNVGIGNTNATSALTVSGHGKFTGIVTATTFVGNVTGNLTGTASTATAAATAYNLVGTATTATAAALAYGLAGTPNISVAVVSASSTITAAKFVGDGAGLTGVTASGTGIVIKDGGSLVGTAGTIDFGTALSVTAISGAAVTVTATTPTNMTPATLTVAGVSTFSGNIGLPDNVKASWGSSGVLDLCIYHDNGAVADRIDSGNKLEIRANASTKLLNEDGSTTYAVFNEGGSNEFYFSDTKKAETTNEGLKITGITSTTTLEVNERYGVSAGFGTFVASAGVAHTVDTFTISTNNFKTAEYTLHLEETTNSQTEKVLVMQNGTTAFSNEYAVMYNGNLLVSIGATVASGAVKLEVTPRAGISGLTTYRFTRETMK